MASKSTKGEILAKFFDDGEYTPVELEEHKLESLDVDGLYDAIVSDLDKAMRNPENKEWNITLEDGDRLIVPQYSNTVTINGEVMYPNTVPYKPGAKLSYYINQAGGYSNTAQKKKVFAVHMNGTVTQVHKAEDIQPGCEILVPKKFKRNGMSASQWISMGSTTVSLMIVIATMILNR